MKADFQERDEKKLLMEEVWVSRRAAEITAQMVVEQFEKMEQVQRRLEEKAAMESALNALLGLSLTDLPQNEMLNRALDLVLSTPWLDARGQAAILLVEDEPETLVMKAQRGLPAEVQSACGRVRFGHCLCGSTAAVREPVFVEELALPEMTRQQELRGGYCVPLVSSEVLLGVLTVHVNAGHRYDAAKAAFLRGAADVLAGVIERQRIMEKLRQATKAADAANRAKSSFLANMSHELRTPLNAIIGYSEMLQEEAEDTSQDGFVLDLKTIQAAGRHLLELINSVLDLSKIEAGKMELYLETFDVAAMIQDVVTVVQPLLAKNANQLQVRCEESIGRMSTDLTKLRQSVLNLLSNACKFTERGTIHLEVTREAASQGDESDWITLSVRDTGIGMTADQLARIFQPFTQAEAGTSRQFGGTGLGLSITQSFCHIMGGDISVESTPGEGTIFRMRLPVNIAAGQETERTEVARTRLPEVFGSGTRLLVIDDEPAARDLMQRFLSKEGFSVITAASGPEGLRLAKALHPDAITLDVMMPGMDGWAALKELKFDPDLADIPVIMLTMVDSMNLGYALGAAEYLTKPVDRTRLLAVLENYRRGSLAGTVLVVEDDVSARDMLRRMLERENWTVAEACNGREALEWLSQNEANVILLDLMMPQMDGFEFVEHWHVRDPARSTPILVVTSKDLSDDDHLRLNGYVEKIVQKGAYAREQLMHEIQALLQTCLRRKSAKQAHN